MIVFKNGFIILPRCRSIAIANRTTYYFCGKDNIIDIWYGSKKEQAISKEKLLSQGIKFIIKTYWSTRGNLDIEVYDVETGNLIFSWSTVGGFIDDLLEFSKRLPVLLEIAKEKGLIEE